MSTFTDNFVAKDYYNLSFEIENAIANQNDISVQAKDAGWLRSALSRAYYSVFLSLREEFLNNPQLRSKITNTRYDHGIISRELNKLPANLYPLKGFFDDLRSYRNKADYKLPPNYEVDLTKVNTANQKALRIFNNLQAIISNL